ncbi:MAG TPA: hypothetical protein PKD91_12900 [Bacteroidia bacterium]|nr:hypothetical protein [Bacteroidia bacterium]
MSHEEIDWIQTNLDHIRDNWMTVDNPEEADLRLTTNQIAWKFFEFSEVPNGTKEMLQKRLLELGFKRAFIEWPVVKDDPDFTTPEKCFAMCWLLKKKTEC